MPAIFDLLYREYCRARLAEMRKQLLISPKRREVPEALCDAKDGVGAKAYSLMGIEGLMKTVRLAMPSTPRSSLPRMPRKPGSRKTTRRALPLSMRFWSEPHRPPDRLRHACHLGSGDNLARDGVAVGSIHRVWNHKGPHWRGPSLENLFGNEKPRR